MNNTRIDRATQVQLMDRRVINWIRTVELTIQICAIKIIAGDGDCLLDAVLVALCGSEQSRQDLERYIGIAVMNSGFLDRIYERFIVKRRSGNLELPEASCIQMHPMDSNDTLQRNNGADRFGRLTDDRQLFLLANVLRRPIILLFDENGNVSSRGVEDLTGVYLPLLCHPDECIKTPILLAYCDHFVPLVGIKTTPDANTYIPLVTCDFCHLPIHFLKSDEEPRAMDILQRYLVLQEVPHVADNDTTIPVLVAKVNCEESAPWRPVERVNVPDADQTSGGFLDSSEKSAEEKNHHNNPSHDEANTSESRDENSTCAGGTDDSDEEDTCVYPKCDKPAEWWPFCYRHSPDSGYAPGALLDCCQKHIKEKNDSQLETQDCDPHDQSVRQTCDADQNNTAAIVECVQAEPTCDFNYTSGTDDSDEDDTCFYPNCDKPAEWWPFCYRHSPDSGYAPGALLDCHEKYTEKKKISEP